MVGRKREEKKRRRRRKKEEEKKEEFKYGTSLLYGIHDWNFGLEHLFCLELLYLLVWNLFVWICWLGNPPSSLFAYV